MGKNPGPMISPRGTSNERNEQMKDLDHLKKRVKIGREIGCPGETIYFPRSVIQSSLAGMSCRKEEAGQERSREIYIYI